MPVTYNEILRTDCLGESLININNNFDAFRIAITTFRTALSGGTWSVVLGDLITISKEECIGDSLLSINNNISLVKEALREIKIQAGSALSACSFIDFDDVSIINGNECIGDSRNKLNYTFGFFGNVCNCFSLYI